MAYGLEVYNSSGTKIISVADRLTRFVVTGTVSVPYESYADVPISGMADNDTWGVSLSSLGAVFQFSTVEITFLKQTNNLRISYYGGSNPFGQTPAPTMDVTYYVFRV